MDEIPHGTAGSAVTDDRMPRWAESPLVMIATSLLAIWGCVATVRIVAEGRPKSIIFWFAAGGAGAMLLFMVLFLTLTGTTMRRGEQALTTGVAVVTGGLGGAVIGELVALARRLAGLLA